MDSVFSKADQANMIKWLGGTESAKQFVEYLATLVQADHALSSIPYYAITASEQHRHLKEIRLAIEKLLQKLEPVCCDEGQDISKKPADIETVSLINNAFHTLSMEKLLAKFEEERLPEDVRAKQSLEHIQSLPLNCVVPIAISLKEFLAAIKKAELQVKPKPGNSEKRSSKNIRRRDLAKNFVFWYRAHFGHFAPLTKEGPVHQVFQMVLCAAGLADDDSDSAYNALRKAIEEDKEIFKNSPEALEGLKPKRPSQYRKRKN